MVYDVNNVYGELCAPHIGSCGCEGCREGDWLGGREVGKTIVRFKMFSQTS